MHKILSSTSILTQQLLACQTKEKFCNSIQIYQIYPSSGKMSSTSSASQPTARVTAEEKLVKDAALLLTLIAAAVLFLNALAASATLYMSLLPVLYLYGLQTCPSRASFDAKRELRCVLRGDSLPQDHPDKPKTGFGAFVKGAMATLTSEIATLPGYQVEMLSLWGAAWVVTLTLPTSDLACVWIGCNHRWYYWGSRSLSETPMEDFMGSQPSTAQRTTVKNRKQD